MKWSTLESGLLRSFLLASFLAISPVLVSCSGSASHPEHSYARHPMTAYLQPDLAGQGTTEPRIHITVPLRNLVFCRQDAVISGGLEVVVVAWREERQVGGAVVQEMLTVKDWAATESDSLLTLDVRVLLDTTQDVILEVRARSLGTSRSWVRRIAYDPDHWRRLPLIFTAWDWNADTEGVLNTDSDDLLVELTTVRVAGSSWPAQGMAVGLLLRGHNGFEMNIQQEVAVQDSFHDTFLHRMVVPLERLPFGLYRALARLVREPGSDNESIRPWYPSRELLVTRINFFDDQAWHLQIDWLRGLFRDDEIDELERLEAHERGRRWAGLWDSRAPGNKGEMEHLHSILEADQRFDGPVRGAETDRGRAWIRYGQPDYVEQKGNQEGRYRHWEIWHYQDLKMNLNFLDAHGLGEYRLIQTDFSTD